MLTNTKEKLGLYRNKVELEKLLKNSPLILEEFVEHSLCNLSPSSAWQIISRYEIEPAERLTINSTQEEINKWMISCLERSDLGKETFLSIGGLGNLPWARIKIQGNEKSMVDFIETLKSKEVIFLNKNKRVYVAFLEEEKYIEFYLMNCDKKVEQLP